MKITTKEAALPLTRYWSLSNRTGQVLDTEAGQAWNRRSDRYREGACEAPDPAQHSAIFGRVYTERAGARLLAFSVNNAVKHMISLVIMHGDSNISRERSGAPRGDLPERFGNWKEHSHAVLAVGLYLICASPIWFTGAR